MPRNPTDPSRGVAKTRVAVAEEVVDTIDVAVLSCVDAALELPGLTPPATVHMFPPGVLSGLGVVPGVEVDSVVVTYCVDVCPAAETLVTMGTATGMT